MSAVMSMTLKLETLRTTFQQVRLSKIFQKIGLVHFAALVKMNSARHKITSNGDNAYLHCFFLRYLVHNSLNHPCELHSKVFSLG